MARFDIETFLGAFETALKANLASAITSINAEKNDTLLDQIPASAWIFQSLDDKAKNYKNFVFYYLDNVQTIINGPIVAENYTIEVDLFIIDRQDLNVEKRILRYRRALKEAVVATWGKIGKGFDSPTISTTAAIDIKINNQSQYHKVFGVSIDFAIAD